MDVTELFCGKNGNAGKYYDELPRCKDLCFNNRNSKYNINYKITKSFKLDDVQIKIMRDLIVDNYGHIKNFCKINEIPINKTYQLLNNTERGYIITRGFVNRIRDILGLESL